MIGIVGSRADPVMVHFATHCVVRETPFAVIDVVELAARGDWSFSLPPAATDVFLGDEVVHPIDLSGIYVRPIYLGRTPSDAARWRGLLDGFTAWLCETSIPVVNRPHHHQLNSLKPAHYAWLSTAGLLVPEWLVSTDTERLAAFAGAGRTVVKPLCGTRATTREVTPDSFAGRVDWDGPVMVQRLVPGDDVRAHVIGDKVVACRFRSEHVDYRSDRSASREVTQVPDELAARLVTLTADQGLAFAGWDFKVDADGVFWCLECNPMPGYSFYDRVCAGAISDALIGLLTG